MGRARLQVHLQVKGASDRLMVTDAVHHVADVAPLRQAEVGGQQLRGVGVIPALPSQSPQDAVGPCRLAPFLTGGEKEEKRGQEKGLAGKQKTLLPPRPGSVSSHEILAGVVRVAQDSGAEGGPKTPE